MKSVLSLFAFACALASSTGNAQDTRRFDLPEFSRLDVSSGVILVADVGKPQSVVVSTHHGDYSDFEIDVRNGELSVSRKWNRLSWHDKKSDYKVVVSMPSLSALDVSTGSHAKVSNIRAEQLSLDLSSGAHVSLDGECENCIIDLASGANLNAKMLKCESANIDVSSGGYGIVSVARTVNGDASSGGHVAVYGNPELVTISKSSGGRIKIVSNKN